MKKMVKLRSIAGIVACVCAALNTEAASRRQEPVIGGPRGIHPYLYKGASRKNLVETARDHQWSIQFHKSRPDTLHIVAIRIEFAMDTSVQTTGNGLFGIHIRGGGDKEEKKYYENDTSYVYDDLPHDSLYFARQLDAVAGYFRKVSRGNLVLEYSIFPAGDEKPGYVVDTIMPYYSPGGKKRKESWDEYYERKTIGLITFVRDALRAADRAGEKSPFAGLRYNPADGTIRDGQGRKTVFLILHAGASYLTDGGEEGSLGQDTPSDMIDAFITRDFFKYYRDTLALSDEGVTVEGKEGAFLIDEVMMCSETSNQDGLNWGIQGIIVNQVARQIGIPDLFSTSSGISGVGSFCIMDFAGYSAAKGFIPPYPSAWVRAFMGWDNVFVVPMGAGNAYRVKALTSVLDRDTSKPGNGSPDTTILMVPLNDHEYYLIENRQRNLSGNRELFRYDSSDFIKGYPYLVNIEKNVLSTSGKSASNVILGVRNNDIGIPASGVLVWHIDERIIRNRLDYNAVNSDSLYRGVSLVEADGVTDLGIMFQDIFYQAAFDYGGAEDVFPHSTAVEDGAAQSVEGFGPMTRPSTRANDGGHTYLELKIRPTGRELQTERMKLGRNDGIHTVTNYSDSVFSVSVKWNYLAPNWPKRAFPGRFHDPLFVDIDKNSMGKELFLSDESGRIYIWPSDTSAGSSTGRIAIPVDRVDLRNDTLPGADTVYCFDSIPGVCAMPSEIGGTVFVPSRERRIHLFSPGDLSADSLHSTVTLPGVPSTYVCNYRDSSWAVGCEDGRVVFGRMRSAGEAVRLSSDKPVCALAALRENGSTIVAIQTDGRLSLLDETSPEPDSSIMLPDFAIGPFTIVTGDLDRARDSASEIVVCDSRHGMWVYTQNLSLAPGWSEEPSDWPSYYRTDTTNERASFPVNPAPPAIADVDRDGYSDIVVGGTNGLYAFNYKGSLKSGWPAFLDKRFSHWYQRGSVVSSPAVVTGEDGQPLVLFSSITGEKLTYEFTRVVRADIEKGMVWFEREPGVLDSIGDFTAAQMDTILDLSDSIISPYVMPGGILDAVDGSAKRPLSVVSSRLQSNWPLTAGSPLTTSPLIGFMDNDDTPDLVAVSTEGWVYRWELEKRMLPGTLSWPQTGFNSGRSFAFGGKALAPAHKEKEPITYFSFPNPVPRKVNTVTFKYKFSGDAEKVRLDIFSYTGFKVYSNATMGVPPLDLTGSYPDWNLHTVSLDKLKLGPGVYRCRMEARINGKTHHRYWKMAVIR